MSMCARPDPTRFIVPEGAFRLIDSDAFKGLALTPQEGAIAFTHLTLCGTAPCVSPAFAVGQVVIRDNHIRYLDGQFDPLFLAYAFDVKGVRNLTLRDNVIESAVAVPVTYSLCGKVTFFDNRTTGAQLLPFLDPATGKPREELDSAAEVAFVLSCFDKR